MDWTPHNTLGMGETQTQPRKLLAERKIPMWVKPFSQAGFLSYHT